MKQHNILLNERLRALIEEAGSQGADATRALLILGAAAAGMDVAACQRDMRRLIARDFLNDATAAALSLLLHTVASSTTSSGASVTTSATTSGFLDDDDVADADPLATIGIAV